MRSADWPLRSPARSIRVSILAALVATLGLLSPWSSNPSAQAGAVGQWQILTGAQNEVPINPIHVGLMTDGRVLLVAGSGNDPNETNWRATVWDPLTRTFATQPTPFDMFCNGMVNLPDGRMFINGGNLEYDPFTGENRSAIYDPKTEVFTNVEDMADGRWYPTPTVLGDGRIWTFSGLDVNGSTNSTVEIYTVGSGWSQEYGAAWTPPLYPRMHLLPNGNLFYSGWSRNSRIFNTTTNTWSATIATTVFTSSRTYGTSVLLPLSPPDYRARVMILGGANPATNTTEVIEPLAASPAWSNHSSVTTPMSQARIQLNATILPSGRILVTGGSSSDENENTASLNADLFNPDATPISRSSAGANALPRVYHSNALLLPDATVMLTGGNPERRDYESLIEIYSPAYLFNSNNTPAARPIITDGPSSAVNYGATFEIETPNAASITSVVAIRPGTPSHSFDFEQRMVRLSFTVGSGVLNVVAPPNGNIAPPGYYMVFILNSAGVPSTARFVQFLASGGGGTTTLTAAPATGAAGALVTATWSNIINPAPMDWIGIYTPGAADTAFLSWAYVNCLQTPGAAAASGSCALPGTSSLSPGTYQFRLFRNDGLDKLATSNNFAVSAPSGSATVTVTPPSVPAGGSVTVGWSGITGPAAMDWFGLYTPGAPNLSHIDWKYVSCTQTPSGPVASGQCSLPLAATLAAGQYEIRLFRNDGYTLMGVSPAFTVTLPTPPTLTASPSTVVRGTSVTATWSGITGASPTDWIGLYTPTGADGAFIGSSWRYVNCSQTPGGPVPAGSCAIPVPASVAPGSYQLRLFRNDGYVKMATSNNFTVTQ